jgi:hypothetical protein
MVIRLKKQNKILKMPLKMLPEIHEEDGTPAFANNGNLEFVCKYDIDRILTDFGMRQILPEK